MDQLLFSGDHRHSTLRLWGWVLFFCTWAPLWGQEELDPELPVVDGSSGALLDPDLWADFDPLQPLLQAYPDGMMRTAFFDWGAVFYRWQGLETAFQSVAMAGFGMNHPSHGRASWSDWGGLNDLMRNQTLVLGTQSRGTLWGQWSLHTDIELSPSLQRPGTQVTLSASNRTYQTRTAITRNGRMDLGQSDPLYYSVSASGRWGQQGLVAGTPYEAYAFYAGLERKDRWTIQGFSVRQDRGVSAPMTQEVIDLMGRTYNPYWGWQQGAVRHARLRELRKHTLMAQVPLHGVLEGVDLGLMHQWGQTGRSRLAGVDAPNPSPVYYRYLPAYFAQSPVGAQWDNAYQAAQHLQAHPQIPWDLLYEPQAEYPAYVLQTDRSEESWTQGYLRWNLNPMPRWRFSGSLVGSRYTQVDDSRVVDLSDQPLVDDPDRAEDDDFFYAYTLNQTKAQGYAEVQWNSPRWLVDLGLEASLLTADRNGVEPVDLSTESWKINGLYRFSGRHWARFSWAQGDHLPGWNSWWVDARRHSGRVPGLAPLQMRRAALSYEYRWPDHSGRLTAFQVKSLGGFERQFYYTQTAWLSDLVQEVTTGINTRVRGVEWGHSWALSPEWTLDLAFALMEARYTSDASLALYFDDSAALAGTVTSPLDFGAVRWKDQPQAVGPKQAAGLSLNYRSPRYWWASMRWHRFAQAQLAPAKLRFTDPFFLDAETLLPLQGITPQQAQAVRNHPDLPTTYLTHLSAGKSWLKNNHYLSVFLSVNNLLDADYFTGGFQSSRLGTYTAQLQDLKGGRPIFGTSYWLGARRNFFLNLSYRF